MSDLGKFTPDADSELFGKNVACTNKILAKILLDWTSTELGDGKKRQKYLTAIYFDKLTELFCRIWDQLQAEEKIRYKSAYSSYRGIHGPGRAISINRQEDDKLSLGTNPKDYRRHKLAYITEIIEKIYPPVSKARIPFKLIGDAWNSRCRIEPQIAHSQWRSWLEGSEDNSMDSVFLTARELSFVMNISQAIRILTKEEIRALGTHPDASNTIAGIQFNLNKWQYMSDKLTQGHQVNDAENVSERLKYIAQEIKRKCVTNRSSYESGIRKLKEELKKIGDADLQNAINKVQAQTTSEIWDNDSIVRYAKYADIIHNVSIYLEACIRILYLNKQLSSRELEALAKITKNLDKEYSRLGCSFPDPADIQKTSMESVSDMCRRVKREIWERIPHIPEEGKSGVP